MAFLHGDERAAAGRGHDVARFLRVRTRHVLGRRDRGDQVEVEPELGRLRRVVLVDVQKNKTEFRFERIRENRALSEELFRFTAPSGVEIVLADGGLPRAK